MNIRGATIWDFRSFIGDQPGLEFSLDTVVFEKEDRIVAMVGVYPFSPLSNAGIVWARIEHPHSLKREIVKYAKGLVEHFYQKYEVLLANPSSSETKLAGWFRWLGFHIDPSYPPVYVNGRETTIMRYEGGRRSNGFSSGDSCKIR